MFNKKEEFKKTLGDRFDQINKKKNDKVRGVAYQFQEIACELVEKLKVKKGEQAMLFSFLKRKVAQGHWGKIKEVSKYMEENKITSVRYFMKALSDKSIFKNDK